jgi:hypothetical protein
LVAVSFPALKHFRLLELIHLPFLPITQSTSKVGVVVEVVANPIPAALMPTTVAIRQLQQGQLHSLLVAVYLGREAPVGKGMAPEVLVAPPVAHKQI